MKLTLAVLGLASLLAANAFAAGSEAIIKQRAKDLSNQNNVRQGIPPAGQPPPPTIGPTRPAMTPQQMAMAHLQADFAAFKPNSPATAEQKQKLARDLMALAQGAQKPAFGRFNKLAEDISAALAQKNLSEGTRSRLLQDLNGAFNPANVQPTQMQDIFSDVQAIFQSNGSTRKEAVAIADDVKAITGEIQKPAGK
jgi:hypothetical protein